MRKTKKEKLKAAFRRQKEFERLKFVFEAPQKEEQVETQSLNFDNTQNADTKLSNLTNLSYLPKQLVKIGIVTLALISVQIVLYFIIF